MRIPDLKTIVSEPARHGIATGFAILSAAAGIQVASSTWSGTSPLDGIKGLVTAFVLAAISGSITGLLSSTYVKRQNIGLKVAEAIAMGDFSAGVMPENRQTSLGLALETIAAKALQRETEYAIDNKDVRLRLDQLSDALDALPFYIAVFNKDGLLVSANRAYLTHCLEVGAVVALGMTCNEVLSSVAMAPGTNVPANERQTWIHQQEAYRSEALATKMPVRFKCTRGRTMEIAIVNSNEGNSTEIVQDVTCLIESEERTQRAIREATAAESIKQVTISRLSHTIRTPMTGVLAATELLANSELDVRQRERLEIIRRSASTLLGVVQDMFDMATQSEPIEHSILNPAQSHRTALVLQSDQDKMTKSIEDLASQGFEIGCAESVELLFHTLKVLAGQNRLPDLVMVPDYASRDMLLARLGPINKSGGMQVEVHREEYEGTAFPEVDQSGLHKVDLIIVESDEVNRIAYANALSASKLKYRIACTADEAMDMAKSIKCKLFLIDMTLPDMDGLQTAAAIRKVNGNKPGLVSLVAMTSHFVNGDKAKSLSNGLDGYVLKPATGEEIIKLAETWLTQPLLQEAS